MDELIEKIKALESPISVGLDSSLEYIPDYIKNEAVKEFGLTKKAAAMAILNFNKQIIDAIYDVVPAIKLQLAYYELIGYEGILAMEQTMSYAKTKGKVVKTFYNGNIVFEDL